MLGSVFLFITHESSKGDEVGRSTTQSFGFLKRYPKKGGKMTMITLTISRNTTRVQHLRSKAVLFASSPQGLYVAANLPAPAAWLFSERSCKQRSDWLAALGCDDASPGSQSQESSEGHFLQGIFCPRDVGRCLFRRIGRGRGQESRARDGAHAGYMGLRRRCWRADQLNLLK